MIMVEMNPETRRENRYRKLEQRKKLHRLLLLMFILVLVVTTSIISYAVFSNKTYQNKDEFKSYATAYFKDSKAIREAGETKEIVTYGKPLSCAMEYPVLKESKMNEQINTILQDYQSGFEKRYQNASEEEKRAMLVNYESFKTPKEAVSIVLHKEQQMEKDNKMESVAAVSRGYNFSTVTGRVLSATQIFENDYRTFCSDYMNKYFKDKYSSSLIEGKYQKVLGDSDKNFNNFSMSEEGVTFYFTKGTVVSEAEGEIAVTIGYDELQGVIRDEISVRDLDPNKPMVALTYDDGPYPASSNRILDCLEENGVVATFYELGQNVAAYPEVLKRQKELGMEIGSHSWSHPNLNTLSAAAVKEQLDKTNGAIKKAIGHPSESFRPPYGNSNKNVQKYANAPVVLWSVDTLDWKSRNAASIESVVKGVKNLDGRVILMHSIYDSTAEATENLVPWLLDQGYQLVTVRELLEHKYNDQGENGKFYGYNYFYMDKDK